MKGKLQIDAEGIDTVYLYFCRKLIGKCKNVKPGVPFSVFGDQDMVFPANGGLVLEVKFSPREGPVKAPILNIIGEEINDTEEVSVEVKDIRGTTVGFLIALRGNPVLQGAFYV